MASASQAIKYIACSTTSGSGSGASHETAAAGIGGANAAGGTGLTGLADRIAALDGELLLTSRTGQGTVLTAKLPYG